MFASKYEIESIRQMRRVEEFEQNIVNRSFLFIK